MTDRRDNRPPDEGWVLPARELTYPEWYAAHEPTIPDSIVLGEN